MWYRYFSEFGLYSGVILTIVVLGRCYSYFCGRCYCQYFVGVVLLVADGKPLRSILSLKYWNPRSPPIGDYIAAVELTCQSLAQGEAEELRAEVKAVLKKIQPPRPNISREEQKALKELRKDNTRIVLTADKGVHLVVMDKEEYIKKA